MRFVNGVLDGITRTPMAAGGTTGRMSDDNELDQQRRANLDELEQARRRRRTRARFVRTDTISALVAAHGERTGAELEALRPETTTAGRILAIRSFGKANFLVLSDGVNRIQVYIRQDALPERDFAVFKLLDFGDFVGVQGRLFRTKTNELTIWASGADVPRQVPAARCRRSGTACRTSRSATASGIST